MAAPRRNLASLVADFDKQGRGIAIVTSRGVRSLQTSYRQLSSLSHRFAAELVKRNITKGDRVLLWGENSAEWVAAFFGCVLRGVLPVPIDFAGTFGFLTRITREVSPKLLVASRDRLAGRSVNVPALVLEDLPQCLPTEIVGPLQELSEDDPLQIVFTSGTTGEPKGIVHTHGNVLASLTPIEGEMQKYLKYERLVHPIRFLHTLPLSHVFGQFMGLWLPPLLGAEVHFQSRLVPAEMTEIIRRRRISVVAAVPRVLDMMQRHVIELFPELDDATKSTANRKAWQRWWRFRKVHRFLGLKFWAFVCGGASLSPAGEEFWRALGFAVIQGYGMTETTALVSLNHPFRPTAGTIGQVLPGREVKLTEEGEVLVRGDTISRSTWHEGRLQEQEGEWLATGDLAEFDPQGNLRFRGRKKEVIVTSSGLNIYPEDLEAALGRQHGVKASTIVEIATEHGPEPLSVLVADPQTDPNSVIAGANAELAEFQQIRRWLLWPEPDLPRTSTGKVLRREVARRIAAGEITQHDGTALSDSQLSLDSLARVQMQARLEQQYGINLDDAAWQTVKTQADAEELVRQAPTTAVNSQRKGRDRHIYSHWPWNPVQQAIRSAFLEIIALPVVRFLASPRVQRGPQSLPAGPMLLVSNHITSYDAPFILFALPRFVRRRVAIAMSGEMLLDFRLGRNQGNWFLDLVAPAAYFLMTALFNVFPLPQFGGFQRSFRHAGEAVDRGYSVIVFPEGRRSDDGTPQPFKTGAGLLWKDLNIPALPVHLSGLGEIKATGARWFRAGKISVEVRELLPINPDSSPEELTERLRCAVFGLTEPSRPPLARNASSERSGYFAPDPAKERLSENADSEQSSK